MEVIYSKKPDIIIVELEEKCICLTFLSFTFEQSIRQAKSRLKMTL